MTVPWTRTHMTISTIFIVGALVSLDPFLLVMAGFWMLLAIISFFIDSRLEDRKFRLEMDYKKLEHDKFVHLAKRLERIEKLLLESKRKTIKRRKA